MNEPWFVIWLIIWHIFTKLSINKQRFISWLKHHSELQSGAEALKTKYPISGLKLTEQTWSDLLALLSAVVLLQV